MKDSIHVSKENYLKAILEAEAEGHQVIPAMLAHWLEVSAPAVTMALKRLKRDGLRRGGRGRNCAADGSGPRDAYHTALRHHLIERMLSEVFGMEWYEIHEEAERLEHAVSPAFEAKLKEKLGEGGACPHGNAVLPVSPASASGGRDVPLSEALEAGATPSPACRNGTPSCCFSFTRRELGPAKACASTSQNYDQTVSIELNTEFDSRQTGRGSGLAEA
jgi:DtxR family Mn-dependent transcriptional regulator